MAYYRDLREYIEALKTKGKLRRIKREVVRETDIAPLYWLQHRGLPESEQQVLFFEKVTDVAGRKHFRVLTGPYAPSREIFALGLMRRPEEIREKWAQAVSDPIEPEMAKSGPVQEVVRRGDEVKDFTLDEFPALVEAPGFSSGLRTTTQMVTKDPDTGIRNVGTYSGGISAQGTLSVGINPANHGAIHLVKAQQKGMRLPLAIVIGVTPNIAIAATTTLPYGVDELAVAGGLAGEPVKLVKCKTVDLEVPATAEIVIEGEVSTELVTGEGATSAVEYPGYMLIPRESGRGRPVLEISCITHRPDPIFVASFAGYGRHEGLSTSTGMGEELETYRHLKYACGLPVLDVAYHFGEIAVIQIKKISSWDPWQVLNSLAGSKSWRLKIAIAVDEDVDPRDPEAVSWALAYSMQAHRDVRIVTHRSLGLDYSHYPIGTPFQQTSLYAPSGASAMLIDATRKWAYPPVGLPRKDFMERALQIWQEEHFPALNLRKPWHTYHLGYWTEELEENAKLVLQGEYRKLVEKLGERGKKQPYID